MIEVIMIGDGEMVSNVGILWIGAKGTWVSVMNIGVPAHTVETFWTVAEGIGVSTICFRVSACTRDTH